MRSLLLEQPLRARSAIASPGEAEVLVQDLRRRRGAEALHRDDVAGVADPAVPAERARRLDGHAGAARRAAARCRGSPGPARRSGPGTACYTSRTRTPVGLEQLRRPRAHDGPRSRCPSGSARVAAVGVAQHVGAALDRVVGHAARVPHRQALARQREHGRARRSGAARSRQASAVSLEPAGRTTSRFGVARSVASCSIGWCVGPSSPRPIESCVKTKIDGRCISAASRIDALHVVAEDQERRRRRRGSRCRSRPLTIAPMPCSRMPKWRLRPA